MELLRQITSMIVVLIVLYCEKQIRYTTSVLFGLFYVVLKKNKKNKKQKKIFPKTQKSSNSQAGNRTRISTVRG